MQAPRPPDHQVLPTRERPNPLGTPIGRATRKGKGDTKERRFKRHTAPPDGRPGRQPASAPQGPS